MKKTVNHIDQVSIASRLAEIGFPMSVLTPTIDVWIAARNSATPFHAANFGGTYAYHEGVRTLREEGLPHGLEQITRDGVELCVNHNQRTAVVIVTGDARTGDVDNLHIQPSTKYPRGPVSIAVLTAQTSLFPTEGQKARTNPFDVWVLMLHMQHDGTTRVELSLPGVINDEGVILSWQERIFLGSHRGNALPTKAPVPLDLAPTDNVSITVKKRS